MSERILKAALFAVRAHALFSQTPEKRFRRYTGEPYSAHPLEVSRMLARHAAPEEVVIAGLLHDVLEDTTVTPEWIEREFGPEVLSLVKQVTDVADLSHGVREVRVDINRAHAAKASFWGKGIKLADSISNTVSIVHHDPQFAKTYLREKRRMLEVLTDGPRFLFQEAEHTLIAAEEWLSRHRV